jgi:soluble lytic murein transglycosylase
MAAIVGIKTPVENGAAASIMVRHWRGEARLIQRSTSFMSRFFALASLSMFLASAPAGAATIEAQRAAFRAALPLAEAGNWDLVRPKLALLEDYPLLPDLRAAWLRNQLGRVGDAEVREFLARHPDLNFSAELRRRLAGSLARREAWGEFLALYDASFATGSDPVLECHAFTARIKLKRTENLEQDALRRWLSPVSVIKDCDPAFAWLESRGALTAERRRERMELALEASEFNLARWLARPLGEAAVAEVARWQQMHGDPGSRLANPSSWEDSPRNRALMVYGFTRLASSDLSLATQRWPEFRTQFEFDPDKRGFVDRRIALLHAWRHLPGAAEMLAALPPESQDAATREWSVRMAIRAQDWTAIGETLAQLDPAVAAEPVWRYWQARVLESTGLEGAARLIYEELAQERGYYSFLSADRIEADYNWRHAATTPDDELLAALEQRPDIARARELFFTGLEPRGRTEWQQALARLSSRERAQAGILAGRWGWYSRSITAATGAGIDDDLDLRFPLPWRAIFEEKSRRAGISSAWAYGVARSESMFMPDVSSGAGAVGLMQLLPGTGQQTARLAGVSYTGRQTLLDPASNVALGTTYLSQMLARYKDHRVLATAAYNAGPGRVDRWLPEDRALPADAWVDSVPFNETRNYVQRVLSSEAVFQWRLSGETARISDSMKPVPPKRPVGAASAAVKR